MGDPAPPYILPEVIQSHPSPLLYQLLMIHKIYSQQGPPYHGSKCGETENNNQNKENSLHQDKQENREPLDLSKSNKTDLMITSRQGLNSHKYETQPDTVYESFTECGKPAGLKLLSTCSAMIDYRKEMSGEQEHVTPPSDTKDVDDDEAVIAHFISGKIKQYGKQKRRKLSTTFWEISEKEAKIQSKMARIQNKYARIKQKLKRLEKTRESISTSDEVETLPDTSLERNCDSLNEVISESNTPEVNCVQCRHISNKSADGHQNNEKQIISSVEHDEVLPDPDPCTLTESDLVEGAAVLLRREGVYHPGILRCILPPDIYGVLVTRDRGNKPVILPREELIKDVIKDLRPVAVSDLTAGSRVCAFWSHKIPFLHPGTVAGPDTEEDFVVIELDDGDCRDIHIDQVRYIPDNSLHHQDSSVPKRSSSVNDDATKLEPASQDCHQIPAKKCKTMPDRYSAIPSQPRQPWTWLDSGQKLTPKARNVYHNSIERNGEKISVGDCAVFLSEGESARPYIGRIHSMWQTTAWGMKVRVQWLYHEADVVGGGEHDELALYSSQHYDENNVQTISHKCEVQLGGGEPGCYYIAGEYNPVQRTVIHTTSTEL